MKNIKKFSLILLLLVTIIPLSGCASIDINEFIKSSIDVEATELKMSDGIWSLFQSYEDAIIGDSTTQDATTQDPNAQNPIEENTPEEDSTWDFMNDYVSVMEIKLTNKSKKYINNLPLEVTGIDKLDDLEPSPWYGDINMIAAPGDSNTFMVITWDADASEVGIKLASSDDDEEDNKNEAKSLAKKYLSSRRKTNFIYPSDVELTATDIKCKKVYDTYYTVTGTLDVKNKTKKDIDINETFSIISWISANSKIDNIYNLEQIDSEGIEVEANGEESIDFTLYAFSANATADFVFNGQADIKNSN